MDLDLEEWTEAIVLRACLVIVYYEEHLRSREPLGASKNLAKAMRMLKEEMPDEVLDTTRDKLKSPKSESK